MPCKDWWTYHVVPCVSSFVPPANVVFWGLAPRYEIECRGWESLSQHCFNVYVELRSLKRPKSKMTLVFPPSIFRCTLLVWGWVFKDTLQTWGFRNHSIPQIHRWTKEGATQRDHRREAKRIWWFTGWRGLGEKMVECFAVYFHEAFPWTLEKLQVFDSWDSEPHHLIIQSFGLLLFPALPLIRKNWRESYSPWFIRSLPPFFSGRIWRIRRARLGHELSSPWHCEVVTWLGNYLELIHTLQGYFGCD